jgi:hypothetical protein
MSDLAMIVTIVGTQLVMLSMGFVIGRYLR